MEISGLAPRFLRWARRGRMTFEAPSDAMGSFQDSGATRNAAPVDSKAFEVARGGGGHFVTMSLTSEIESVAVGWDQERHAAQAAPPDRGRHARRQGQRDLPLTGPAL